MQPVPTQYDQSPYEIFLGGEETDLSPFGLSDHYVDDLDRNVMILHSSGTTGFPKPLYSSHRFLLGFTAAHDFATAEESQGLMVSTLPLFHVST